VPIDLHRIDDRLIHGQVVVGWGQPMALGFIALVDDSIAATEWEQELYRVAVPAEMQLYFASVDDAARAWAGWNADPRHGILVTATVEAMVRLTERVPGIRAVNLGGLHHAAGRTARLPYIYLTAEEERALTALDARGVQVTARDVPAAGAIPLRDLLPSRGVT
jgi:mannose/fructose/N-acetylgalactosamine-specific phosphotransferase system component IIB